MQYLMPARNRLSAAVGYSAVARSINTRSVPVKVGGGMVSLGHESADSTIEVEIVNNTIVGTPTVSAPVYAGVGNCVLSALAATSGVSAQVFTVTLSDLGTDTRKAFAPFQGVILRAKTAGVGGNDINIEVDESGITRTGTSQSLLNQLVQSQNEYIGEEWNFGAPVINSDGTIPSTAPRISFGEDPQVYRQYREFIDGRYVYRFSPAPVRNVAEGARVKTVTGTRTVTMTNGVTTRTYTSITTLHTLLTAIIADGSALVDVDGVVAVDFSPGGQSITEMSVRTVSYLQSLERDGTAFVRDADMSISVDDAAPTEQLEIRCTDTQITGAEIWSVRGSVSGELQNAVTGVAYVDADYGFTIPQLLAPGVVPAAQKSAALDLISRGSGQAIPTLCIENFLLGVDAQQRTYTFKWTKRRPECDCDDVDVQGGPNGDLLGIDPPEGGSAVADIIPPDLLVRTQTLYTWNNTFVAGNTSILAGGTTVTGDSISPSLVGAVPVVADTDPGTAFYAKVSGVLKVDRVDIEAAKQAVDIFVAALNEVYDTLDGDPIPTAALTDFDSAVTDLQTEFANLSALLGADYWRTWSQHVAGVSDTETTAWIAANATRILTEEFDAYLERYRARMKKFYALAGVQPPFDGATLKGNSVWTDRGGTHWFESENGLLPLQPGYYYHSARLDDDNEPVSTKEFGIGVGIGCGDDLLEGDKLIITISPVGNVRVTYQVGDTFLAKIIQGAPIYLGGGQTGNDTQTWRVSGSVSGVLPDYELLKSSPAAYSETAGAGTLEFLITPGAIGNALGDVFTFYIEGGQFKYRVDGGSWSSNTQIAASVTAGGHVFAFQPGVAPSWVPGDQYSFDVEALWTQARLLSPKHAGIQTGSLNELRIAYPSEIELEQVSTVLYVRTASAGEEFDIELTIEDGSETSLKQQTYTAGAGDNAWDVSGMLAGEDGTYIRVRIVPTGDEDPVLDCLWLGTPFQFELMGGANIEHGEARRQIKFGRQARNRHRLGTQVDHSGVSDESLDAFLTLAGDAHMNHAGRCVVVFNTSKQRECGIVQLPTELDIEEEFNHQTLDPDLRLNRVQLTLDAVA